MMKKIKYLLVVFLLALGVIGCGENNEDEVKEEHIDESENNVVDEKDEEDMFAEVNINEDDLYNVDEVLITGEGLEISLEEIKWGEEVKDMPLIREKVLSITLHVKNKADKEMKIHNTALTLMSDDEVASWYLAREDTNFISMEIEQGESIINKMEYEVNETEYYILTYEEPRLEGTEVVQAEPVGWKIKKEEIK